MFVLVEQEMVYGVRRHVVGDLLYNNVGERYVERWGAGVETQKMYGERLGDGVEYHLMKPTPRR